NHRCGGVIANFTMMFLKPEWANNPAFFTGTALVGIGTANAQFEDFDFNMQFVPKFALGYMGSGGVGVRTTWWGFAESASRDSAVIAISALPLLSAITNETFNDGATVIGPLQTRGHLNMNVWDNEVIYAMDAGKWDFLLGAGIRYAHIAQRYDAVVRNATTGAIVDTLLSGHNFNGAGPTLGLEVKRELGDGGFYTLANVRGSLLFGTRKNSAGTVGTNVQVIVGTAGNRVADSNAVFIPVGEIELGVGYQRSMGRARLIAEASLIAQSWWNAGNSSRSDFIFATTNEALGLFGFGLKLGVTY
ncbi:hypothetical protein AYO44_14030, partial [Planctomycetaceae bacterium SCGC AG-212-F19]